MTIYIENFLIENVLINLCLLKLVQITTCTKTSIFKLILASLIGTSFSIFSAIFINNNFALNIFKLLCALLMIFVAFKQGKKQFVFNLILFFIYTNSMFGIIICANSATYNTNFGVVISSQFNLETICVIVISLTYIFAIVSKHLKHKFTTNKYIYHIKLKNKNISLNLNAYLDTGNLLTFKNQPVIIVDTQTFVKLANISMLDFYTKKFETIKTSTVIDTQNLKTLQIEKLEIKNKNKTICLDNVYIATDYNNSFANTNYKALLSPELF